jgi:transcriptional regulator with XRE-family HTH domain
MQGPQAAQSAPITRTVGMTIRELRETKKMTARDLAVRAGVSAAMISRIESGQVSPSLNVLELLANSLETPVAGLFKDMGRSVSDFTHVRNGKGLKSTRMMGQHLHEFVALGFHSRDDLQFEAVLVTLERNDSVAPPNYTGRGCVFLYVLEGEAVYRYGEREVRLQPGDSLCLDAEVRYGVHRLVSPRFRFLSVQAERR